MAISGIPILPVESISGNQFRAFRIIEEATQTFYAGTPVSVAADGGIQAWNGTTFGGAGTQGAVAGISYEAASGLATTGKGAPIPFSPIVGVGAAVGLFGHVQNQASAVNIAHGAPFNDGRVGFYPATADTVYSAILGNGGNPVTPAATDVGKTYSLSIDSAGVYWYVNRTVTTAVVVVVALDLRDVPAAGTRVLFQFLPTQAYLIG